MLTFDANYFEEETRDGFFINSMMKRAWAAQLEVLEEVKRVCAKLGLVCYADFGTLLGTVRHKGFIPWDDDLDIGMLRADYIKFLKNAPELLDKWFELKSIYSDPEHDNVKARVITGRHMNFDSEYLEKFHFCPYVVGIDIFPIDNIPDNPDEVEKLVTSLGFLLKLEASIPEDGPYSEDIVSIIKQVEEVYGIPVDYTKRMKHEVKKVYDMMCATYVNELTKEVGCMMGISMRWSGYHYPRLCYDNYTLMQFENTTIPVPAGYDMILKSCYGPDYMVPKNIGSSHDYPFYKEQMQGLKEVMEKEFQTTLTDEQMELIIRLKVFGE